MIIYIIQYNTWNPWIEHWLYGLYHLKSRTFFSLIPCMTLGISGGFLEINPPFSVKQKVPEGVHD